MKKLSLLFAFAVVYANAFAQITFTISDVDSANQTQRIAIDTFPLPTINFGNKGANQVYDFSNLTLYKYDTIEYRAPTSGQLNTCPNADVATTTDGINFLLTNTDNANSKLTLEGFEGQLVPGSTLSAAYSTKPDLFRFPTTYQSNFSGTGYLQKAVPGSAVNQPVNQVRLTINTTYTDTIDGWGKVITPLGAYKCLRKKRTETTTTLIEIQFLAISPWSTFSNTTSTTTRYSYITKEAKGSVINFNYDTANVLQSVSWSMVPPTAPVADFSFVNPSAGVVNFTDLSDNYPTTWDWDFGDGATSNLQNPTHNFAANGTYDVCLTVTNAGGSDNICKQVNITGIAAGNNAPVANNDTASVTQPNGLVVNVGLNDVEPDGDNACITDVYGSPAFVIAATGNCTSIQFTPDSTFTGNDTCYYVLCDNASPALCDTAMFVVTVNGCTNLPVVNSVVAQYESGCSGGIGVATVNVSGQTSGIWHVGYSNSFDTLVSATDNDLKVYLELVSLPCQAGADADVIISSEQMPLDVSICYTAQNICGSSTKCDTISLFYESITNIALSDVSMQPSPADNFVTIDMRENTDELTQRYEVIMVYNTAGVLVKQLPQKDESRMFTFSVADLPAGSYIATIKNEKQQATLGRFSVVR